ncbi:MAG TPA: hypothetical protein PLH03_05155, partial [Methylophilaceae bacterium]|nr:hypothetical protein [Methylophilaceae bacterium]
MADFMNSAIRWVIGALLALPIIANAAATASHSPDLKPIQAILEQPENQIDLAKAKLTIDKTINPLIDVEANLKAIDATAAKI